MYWDCICTKLSNKMKNKERRMHMKKLAFIFSADKYYSSKSIKCPDLPGVQKDVNAIEQRLQQLDFDIIKKENILKNECDTLILNQIQKMPNDAISIVYFSGHGGHVSGENYIYPSDFGTLYDKTKNVEASAINIKAIINMFKNKGRLILILDSCRKDLGISSGYYSEMTTGENVYIAYATMFEKESWVANNSLSYFTEAICDEILGANIDIDTVFTLIRQNVNRNHRCQLPSSINALLDKVILNPICDYNELDKRIYEFVEQYGDEYNNLYGYFEGEHKVFIDASKYFNIDLLNTYWAYTKFQNFMAKQQGIKMPVLTENEHKILQLKQLEKSGHFFHDHISYTWYYDKLPIKMGEIPPLPPSMQQVLPERGKELILEIRCEKDGENLIIYINLPNECTVPIWYSNCKYMKSFSVLSGKIVVENATNIKKVKIESPVHTSSAAVRQILGDGCRNLTGKFIKHHPIYGNMIFWEYELNI